MDQKQSEHGPLPPPPHAASQEKSIELIRLWMTEEEGFEMMIRTSAVPDPFRWGMILVDIARNIALFATEGDLRDNGVPVTKEQVLERLREGFDAEWENPTTEVEEWKPDA